MAFHGRGRLVEGKQGIQGYANAVLIVFKATYALDDKGRPFRPKTRLQARLCYACVITNPSSCLG